MSKIPEYQKNYSLTRPDILAKESREIKVAKILSVLADTGILAAGNNYALDIGCSGGYFVEGLAPYFKCIIGLDIDTHALQIANTSKVAGNIMYMTADSMKIPLQDNSVDLIICNHVYEHVPDASRLFSEIHRILKEDGLCYFGAASRLTIIEPHYYLPFLSWLPKKIAHFYMRMMNKGDYYYENLRTYWGIRNLIKDFMMEDYTLKIILSPDKYNARDLVPENSLLEKVPVFVWKLFYYIFPGYIFILKK
jgi:SAM-dependent methyltransferase